MPDTKPAKSAAPTAPASSFEQSLVRLETIVAEMESGELDLDTLIQRFEEGQKLIGQCQARLTDVERRVEALVKAADGSVATVPFQESEA